MVLLPSVYSVELPDAIETLLDALSYAFNINLNIIAPLECMGLHGFLYRRAK